MSAIRATSGCSRNDGLAGQPRQLGHLARWLTNHDSPLDQVREDKGRWPARIKGAVRVEVSSPVQRGAFRGMLSAIYAPRTELFLY